MTTALEAGAAVPKNVSRRCSAFHAIVAPQKHCSLHQFAVEIAAKHVPMLALQCLVTSMRHHAEVQLCPLLDDVILGINRRAKQAVTPKALYGQ